MLIYRLLEYSEIKACVLIVCC